MKKISIILLTLISAHAFAQYPSKQTLGSDSTIIQSKGALKGRIIVYAYPDTTSANKERISQYPHSFIAVGNLFYSRDSTATKWLLIGSGSSAINNGLLSAGGVTLADSTVTINDTIKWSYNGILYTKTTPSSFIINSADSGYYRRDLIYADTSGLLYKVAGVEDTSIALVPNLPDNSVVVTIVDVYGNQIAPPFADSIGVIPNLQQVTNQGNSTTNPIFINANSTQTPLRITSDFNRSNYLYFKNRSNGNWANTGFLFKNNVTDNPDNEWTGHWFRLMMGSTNSGMAKDASILMTNGTGGLKIVSDSGRITFNGGSPAYPYDTNSHVYKEMGAFETDGSFRLNNYKNNVSGDSVLSTDEDGKVILKKVAVGDIDVLQNTVDSSSFGIKKLDGTVKHVVILADGLTDEGGTGGVQTVTGDGVNNSDPVNPVINPERFGMEDNLGIQDRYVDMQGFNFKLNNTAQIELESGDPDYITGTSYFRLNNGGVSTSFYQEDGDGNVVFDSELQFSSGTSGQLTWQQRNTTEVMFITMPFNNAANYFPLSVTDGTGIHYADNTGNITISTGGSSYTLPIASATILGGVKVGSGLAIDGSGVLSATGGTGSTYTASNGLTMSGSDVRLGGALTGNTTIDGSTLYKLSIIGNYASTTNDAVLKVTNSATGGRAIYAESTGINSNSYGLYSTASGSGIAVYGNATTGAGISGVATSGYAGTFSAGTGIGISSYSNSGIGGIIASDGNYALRLFRTGSNNTATTYPLIISSSPSDFPAGDGTGTGIEFTATTTNGGTERRIGTTQFTWADATDATRTSEFSITGVNNTVTNTLLQISGAGVFTLTQGLTDYVDNAAAIAGGLTSGQLYRHGDIVQIVH